MISAAIDEYLGAKLHLAHDTQVWYSYHLNYFARWCAGQGITDLSELTPALVQRAAAEHPRTNTHTRHGLVQVVKGFLAWCAQDEETGIREKVVRRIELPRAVESEVELFTPEDIRKLLRACEKTRMPHRNAALLHVLLDTGLRASELCYDGDRPEEPTGLRMEHLVFGRRDDSYLQVMGKGRKARTIGFGNETRLALQRYLSRERGHASSPYVFLAQGNERPLSVKRLQELLTLIGKQAGVAHVHPHRFRHTFAVNQLMAGTSDLVLMRLLGHTTLDSTKIYVRAMTQLQARQASQSIVDHMKHGRN